jgi:ankyrin repeat protein
VIEGKADVNKASDSGQTPLLAAARKGHIEVVQWLVEEGHADVNQACNKGKTALCYAAHAGCVEVVQ